MLKISIVLVLFFIISVECHRDRKSNKNYGGKYGGGGGKRWTRPNNGCGAGWIGFDRPTGRWCLKAFNGFYQPADAENQCGRHQAVLSAFMNPREQRAVNDDAVRAIAPRTTGSIWLGLKRTARCMSQPLNAQCTALNSFYYTDGSTTGTAGLVWDNTQPDNSVNQACAAYFAAPTAGQSLKHGNSFWLTQRMDDIQCHMATNQEGPRKVVGYLCGRRAQ